MNFKHSLAAAFALALSANAFAAGLELYEDIKTKQIFTEAGEGRQKLGNFVQENNLAEMMSKEAKGTPVFASKAKKLEFEGTHYLGYTSANPRINNATVDNAAGFEMRRNYIQVKGYINDKDYLRVTLDATKELGSSTTYANAYVKYAYLWLNDLPYIPATGAEIGIVHRPWIDYEEHNGWYYRSFNKVALEHKVTTTEAGPDLVNSADLGVNFKTKTPYFTSELGIFNGEGYHADKAANNQKNSTKLSGEWRLTVHPLGDGKKVGKYDRTKDQYLHISSYGLNSLNHKDDKIDIGDAGEYNRMFYGFHAVYNHPYGLLAGQIFKDEDTYKNTSGATGIDKKEFEGYSVNAEIRPYKDITLIGRYDAHKKSTTTLSGVKTDNEDVKQAIYAIAYKANKNVTYIASGKNIKDEKNSATDKNVYMMTAEVKW